MPDHPLRILFDSTDLAQQVWEDVYQKIQHGGTFADAQEFLRFLQGVTQKRFLKLYRDHLLRQQRTLRRRVSLQPRCHDQPVAEADPAAVVAARDELEQRLTDVPAAQRAYLRLLFDEGLPERMAAARGLSLAEARDAIEDLRACLQRRLGWN